MKNWMKSWVLVTAGWASFGCAQSGQAPVGTAHDVEVSCVRPARQSAWYHGQGAPAGQAQVGYGESMAQLHRDLAAASLARADASCQSTGGWSQVR